MQFLNYGQDYHIIIDYAHTPDAFKNVYSFLNKVKVGRIITVTGSAGGRDQYKRPIIGNICSEKADYTVFSTDDPRDEDVKKTEITLYCHREQKISLTI